LISRCKAACSAGAGDGEGHTAGFCGIEEPQLQALGQALEQFVQVGDFLRREVKPSSTRARPRFSAGL
jgi:hypothetical protein